ncbi:MAG: hypothetical protein M1308_09035 [Actinobacteria bacterium]|nr:hypothetical protein [Actinomycetota bacterium]
MKDKFDKNIKIRIKQDKLLLIEQLRKTPIVSVSCEKVGVSRATFYRWKVSDSKFASLADTAIAEGCQLVNDLAESQLLSAIKDKNLGAIIFWLKHHHPAYLTRVEIKAVSSLEAGKLNKKQQEVIEQALRLAIPGTIKEESDGENR